MYIYATMETCLLQNPFLQNPMDLFDDWGRSRDSIGPLFSHPSDSELLFSSSSLCPPVLYPLPHLTPARFLAISGVPPSVSSAIGASLSVPNSHDDASRALSYNRLQFLSCPGGNLVLVFFPTGTNLDQVGFLLLSSEDSGGLRVIGSDEGDVFVAKERMFSRILKILVQRVSDLGVFKCCSLIELGYILVYSMYSVHWYSVKYDKSQGRAFLRYLGRKQFKSCSIASASWSPHLPGECLVLLENGDIFVFDLNQKNCRFRGYKMKISWDGKGKSVNQSWLGCEFGWRPGIFIVARSDAVFVVNRGSGKCTVRSLLDVESLSMVSSSATLEEFVAFSKAGSDSFRFILASHNYLFLCDQRSGMPLLKWQHDVEKPCFIDVYSLSELGLKTDANHCVDEPASCVILGSFWNAQSQMFCYGASPSTDNVLQDPSSLSVWELPHNLLLPTGKCLCGDCILREMKMKESLPEWIDWQKKRVLVLGFGVLNKFLALGSDQSSGFTLIRLTSSGVLEALKFCASSDPFNSLEVAHIDSTSNSDEVNLLYFPDDDYKFPKRFRYLELEYLSAHTKGNLAELLDSKMRKPSVLKKTNSFSIMCHEELCEKLKICGFGRDRSASTITAVFNSISSPTNIFEIALRETWSSLPLELLLLAFSTYSEFEDVLITKPSLEFLAVPEFPQLPPFLLRKPSNRSSKWSQKEQPGVELVGPVLPLPILSTLHEFRNGCLNSQQNPHEFSPEAEFSQRCYQISKVTREVASSVLGGDQDDAISLGNDQDDFWPNHSHNENKPFIAYCPVTGIGESSAHQQQLTTFVSRVRRKEGSDDVGEKTGLELFSEMSPVVMEFEDRTINFDTKALFTSKTLLTLWQDRSSAYQELLSQHHLQK